MECQGMHLNEGLDISMGITCYWHLVVMYCGREMNNGRKLHSTGVLDLASAGRNRVIAGRSSSMVQSDEQEEVIVWDEANTRCPCGNFVDRGTMIQVTCYCPWFCFGLPWEGGT